MDKVVGYAQEISSAAAKAAESAQDISASADVQDTMMGKLLNSVSTAAGTASKAASDAANAAFSASDAMQAATDTESKAYSAWQSAIGTAGETDAQNAYTAAKAAADTATTAARTASADAVTKASDAKAAVDNINSVVGAFGTIAGAADSIKDADVAAQAAYTAGNYNDVKAAGTMASNLAGAAETAGQAFADAPAVIGAGAAAAITSKINALHTAAADAKTAADAVIDGPTALTAQGKITALKAAIDDLQNTVKTNVVGSDALHIASTKLDSESKDAISLQVGDGYAMQISEPGTELLGRGSENLYVMLDGFYKALKSGKTGSELNSYIDKFSGAQNRILSLDAKVGAKVERLGTLSDRYTANVSNYTQMRSDAEDVDMAEAIMNYSSAKTVYDAALASGSQIIQTSLIDFLR